ncbi:zinc metalloproteinase nas-4 isoform X2 [Hydra vulgaris]|uniref:Metalloendopeptidase n=1 Tax=Hydra vulgaris TaxID=6087 RepID=A0ABM4BGQ2_HYDVU
MLSFILLHVFFCIQHVSARWVPQMENSKLFEGDIQLNPSENLIVKNTYASLKRGRWPNNTVPYDLSRINFRNHHYILNAMEEYHKYTCLKFVPKTTELTYISFYSGDGCSSPVGYWYRRINNISLSLGCFQIGTIMHEIGHSIGLFHEQSRTDRDDFVEINWNNVPLKERYNFDKYPSLVDSLGTPYDYYSIMHYGENAFGGGQRTMTTKDPTMQKVIGTAKGFSAIDIKQINLMYSCPGY